MPDHTRPSYFNDGPLGQYREPASRLGRCLYHEGTYDAEEPRGWTFDLRSERPPRPPLPILPPLPDTLGLSDWPDWTGFPVAVVSATSPKIDTITEDDQDLGDLTRQLLPFGFEWSPRPRFGPKPIPTAEFGKAAQDRANKLLANLFEEPPIVRLHLGRPEDWFRGRGGPHWTASSDPGRPDVPLEGLGAAHQRYARFAIQRALLTERNESDHAAQQKRLSELAVEAHEAREAGTPTVFIADEPERAMHPGAEAVLASSLSGLADVAIVATHSTELIDHADRVVHVQADGGTISLSPLSVNLTPQQRRQEAARLGLTPARLASMTGVVVFVEGEHDKAVLEELLKDELAGARAVVIPMGGTKTALTVAESNYLTGSTDAPFVVCLDNTHSTQFTNLHQNLVNERSADKRRRTLNLARTSSTWTKTPEAKVMLAILNAANDAGRLNRIHPHGFEKHDIVEYLPVERFLKGNGSWRDLFNAYCKLVDEGKRSVDKPKGRDYKMWLQEKGAKIYTDGIREVAADVARSVASSAGSAQRHEDFERLALLLHQLP